MGSFDPLAKALGQSKLFRYEVVLFESLFQRPALKSMIDLDLFDRVSIPVTHVRLYWSDRQQPLLFFEFSCCHGPTILFHEEVRRV